MFGIETNRILEQPRIHLGAWPTPLEPPTGSERVCLKRDDCCGFGRGGAKARKIEHLLGHLEAREYDELVVVTGNISNLVFDLLHALTGRDLPTRIFVVNYPRMQREARRAVFADAGTAVCLLGTSPTRAAHIAVTAWREGRRKGRRPFLLLPGAAHPASVAGNAAGFLEMIHQCDAQQIDPRAVFVSVATGTTLAGFVLAAQALWADGRRRIPVIGVAVDRAPLRMFTLALIRWTERAIASGSHTPARAVSLVRPAHAAGFARCTEPVLAACERARRTRGITIDPIFGGKTWLVMEEWLRDRPSDTRPVVYWHCGYTPEWRDLARCDGRRGDP